MVCFLVWLDDWSTVTNAVSWLWLALFVSCWFPFLHCAACHLASLRPLSLTHHTSPPPAPPPAPPSSAQTAISDRRGAWEVQPNRQTNSSYLTSHLAADRHGGSVQVLLHPSLDSSTCVCSCLQPSAAARPTCSQTWLEHFLYGFPFLAILVLIKKNCSNAVFHSKLNVGYSNLIFLNPNHIAFHCPSWKSVVKWHSVGIFQVGGWKCDIFIFYHFSKYEGVNSNVLSWIKHSIRCHAEAEMIRKIWCSLCCGNLVELTLGPSIANSLYL